MLKSTESEGMKRKPRFQSRSEQDVRAFLGSLDPLAILARMLEEARRKSGLKEPWAMSLISADREGAPSARTVLLKRLEGERLIFFSNYESRKGRELEENPKAGALFYWERLGRQIFVQGGIEKTSGGVSDAYWNQRSRNSRISQRLSRQSAPAPDRVALEALREKTKQRFKGRAIPRPRRWGGFALAADKIEFWMERPHRLHDRFLFEKQNGIWIARRLFP